MKFVLCHAGAGSFSADQLTSVRRKLKQSCEVGLLALSAVTDESKDPATHSAGINRSVDPDPSSEYTCDHGTTFGSGCEGSPDPRRSDMRLATEALVSALTILEDCPATNAGYGSNLTVNETVECDACIMTSSGVFGAISAVRKLRNPICGAKCVLKYQIESRNNPLLPPMILASDGAEQFCCKLGIDLIPNSDMVTEGSRRMYRKALAKLRRDDDSEPVQTELESVDRASSDTIGGAVLLDNVFAVGSSSGGPLLKLPGRVGPAATYGASVWSATSGDRSVAALCTGSGENIMYCLLAKTVSEQLLVPNTEPTVEVLFKIFEKDYAGKIDGSHKFGGVLVLVSTVGLGGVELFYVHNTEQFVFAYRSTNESKTVVSSGGRGTVTSGGLRIKS